MLLLVLLLVKLVLAVALVLLLQVPSGSQMDTSPGAGNTIRIGTHDQTVRHRAVPLVLDAVPAFDPVFDQLPGLSSLPALRLRTHPPATFARVGHNDPGGVGQDVGPGAAAAAAATATECSSRSA